MKREVVPEQALVPWGERFRYNLPPGWHVLAIDIANEYRWFVGRSPLMSLRVQLTYFPPDLMVMPEYGSEMQELRVDLAIAAIQIDPLPWPKLLAYLDLVRQGYETIGGRQDIWVRL